MSKQAIPYLGFDGNCAQAMRFLEKALEGKLEALLTGGDSPMADQMSKDYANRIMHACLVLPGGATIFAGDTPPGVPHEGIKGVSITLTYDTVEEAQRIFKNLSEGGQVTMPMAPTFWAKIFGMVTDRFGVPWIINGGPLPMQ